MEIQDINFSRLFRIFLFLGICCIPSFVKGQIIFPGDKQSLVDALNITKEEISTRQFGGFPGEEDNTCFTFQGQTGQCLALEDCPELINFINRNGLQNFNSINFLRSRICRYLFNNVNLCCVQVAPSAFINTARPPVRGQRRPQTRPPTRPVVRPAENPVRVQNLAILPTMAECGLLSTMRRILGGTKIQQGDHPWLVGVGSMLGGNFRILCGGTLISKRHVLTAAHCFVPKPGSSPLTHVRLGDYSLSQNNEPSPPLTLLIKERKSPGYNPTSQLNDIELLTLEKDVQFSNYIRPACLPFEIASKNFDNQPMAIVGWGDTFFGSRSGSDLPLYANISVWSKPRCLEAFARFTGLDLGRTTICASSPGKDACQGDSGGPMLYLDIEKLRYYILGIVSFGRECGTPNFPGVYTFVPAYEDWIKDNL